MTYVKFVFYLFVMILLLTQSLFAENDLPDLELKSYYNYTFNRTLGHKNELYSSAKHTFNDYFSLSGGFSLSKESIPHHFFLSSQIKEKSGIISFQINFLNRSFPEYEIVESSIYPTASLSLGFVDFTLGLAYRILNSQVETASTHTLYNITFRVLDLKKYGLSLYLSNFNDFKAGNISDITYTVANQIHILEDLTIILDGGFSNPGQLSFASYYSTFFARLGVKYKL